MADHTETRLKQLLNEAIAAEDQVESERLLTEYRLILHQHVATAGSALRTQRLLVLLIDDLS